LVPHTADKERYADTERIIGTWLKRKETGIKIILASKIVGKGGNDKKFIRTTGNKS